MTQPHRATILTLATALTLACVGSPDDRRDDDGPPASEASEMSVGPTVRGWAPPSGGLIPSMVTLRPGAASAEVEALVPSARREQAKIDQFGLQFSPTFLIADAGVPLTFTNSEGALAHNVHLRAVASGASLFNEDANSGDELIVTLDEPGGYDVLCDMHPGMTAFVFVSPDPYVTAAAEDGTFTFTGVPPGEYDVRLWTVDTGFGEPIRVELSTDDVAVDLRTPG